jgi:hypothetical protein
VQPVKRLDTLEGKTICGIGTSFHFEVTWPVLVGLLQKKYPTAKFVGPDKITKSDEVGLPQQLKENKCDALIAGNGC